MTQMRPSNACGECGGKLPEHDDWCSKRGDGKQQEARELLELRAWKDSAMKVMEDLDLQECGKVLGLPLGSNIAKHILPTLLAARRGDGKQQEWCDICNAPKVPFCKTHAVCQASQPLTLRILSLTDTHGTTFTAVCEAAWEAIDREGRTIVLTLHEAVCAKCGESMIVGHQCQASQPSHASGERTYAHMCRDEHVEIGHNDSSSELCPLCRAINERDTAFQRGQQAMAEKAAQHIGSYYSIEKQGWVCAGCGFSYGDYLTSQEQRRKLVAEHIRSLAGA